MPESFNVWREIDELAAEFEKLIAEYKKELAVIEDELSDHGSVLRLAGEYGARPKDPQNETS